MSRKRVISAEEMFPEIPETVFLFRSCTGSIEYPGTENANKEVLKLLGVNVFMDPDQTCCSGYLLSCSAYTPEVSLAVTARNLSLAEKKKLDVFVFCNGCFGYLRELSHIMLHNPAYLKMANDMLAPMGYHYEGRSKIFHVQELYYRMKSRIEALVKRPLQGLRVGVQYGCHYMAQQYGILDDGGHPTFIDKIVAAMGGTPVYYKERQACCGYSVGKGFTHKESIVRPHLLKKFRSAVEEQVELLLTVCPGCNTALDREQAAMSKDLGEVFNIPTIDLGQIIALALGVEPRKLGFEANSVPVTGILQKLGFKAEENHPHEQG